MNFGDWEKKPKAWKDIWGCGQGIGSVESILSTENLVSRLESEYLMAKTKLSA
jgi:nitronate monooxygenase